MQPPMIFGLNLYASLGVGIASISNILSPEVIILGGGITEAGDDLFVPLNAFVNQYEWQPVVPK